MLQFLISFLLNGLKFREEFICIRISINEVQGSMTRTTASKTMCMNTGRVFSVSRQHNTRNNPILKSKITVFKGIKVVK